MSLFYEAPGGEHSERFRAERVEPVLLYFFGDIGKPESAKLSMEKSCKIILKEPNDESLNFYACRERQAFFTSLPFPQTSIAYKPLSPERREASRWEPHALRRWSAPSNPEKEWNPYLQYRIGEP